MYTVYLCPILTGLKKMCPILTGLKKCVLQAGRPKKSFLFGHLFLNITNIFWAKKRVGHACICPRGQGPGWSLASQFWSYTPPKLVFPRPKNWIFPTENCCSWSKCFLKKMAFSVFSAKILSRRSRLLRRSRAPSRLIRPRPIYCDAGPKQTVENFPVLGGRNRQKKVFSKGPASSGDLHPKRSPSY